MQRLVFWGTSRLIAHETFMKTQILLSIAYILFRGVAVPAVLLVWLWCRRSRTKLDWFLRFSLVATYVVYAVLASMWSIASLHLRWVLLAALIAASIRSFKRGREAPFHVRSGVWWWLSLGGRVLLVLLFGSLILPAFQARTYRGEALAIASPLRGGRYVVDDGGNAPALNHHNRWGGPQMYAMDITQVNALGVRGLGLLPRQLERYAIFGDTVYSPVSGTVVAAVDGLPDLTPPEADQENPAGNHIWLRTGDVYIVLAHLKKGSAKVRAGETVNIRQPIGQIGNSGYTSEPHLHIHAVRIKGKVSPERLLNAGVPVPLLIEGRFLVRNNTF